VVYYGPVIASNNILLSVSVQPTGASAGDLIDDGVKLTRSPDDAESILSGASAVSYSSYLDWDDVDRLLAEDDQ